MKRKIIYWSWLPLLLIPLVSWKTFEPVDEERQIRDLWKRTGEYICSGDWENYSKSWAHNTKIQVMHPDQGEWLTGWEKIGTKYEAMIKSGMRCSIPKDELILNISKSGDMAWGTVDIVIQFNDSTKTQVHFWETSVFEKVDGQWKMVLGMASIPRKVKK